MKSFAAACALVAVSSAFEAEFIRGCQTGIFVQNEEQFEDYSCEMVGVPQSWEAAIEMSRPMMAMLEGMNKGKMPPTVAFLFDNIDTIGHLASVMNKEYDGGEFCKGLIFAKEGAALAMNLAQMWMTPAVDAPVQQKALAVEKRMRH